MKIGQTFTASAYGYRYVWKVTSEIRQDCGRPWVWAKPIKRLPAKPGKRGYLRAEHIWHLDAIPK